MRHPFSRAMAAAAAAAVMCAAFPADSAFAAPKASKKAPPAPAAEAKAEEAPPPEPPKAPRPWDEGVSEEQQAKAKVLFKDGTNLLNDAAFAPAAAKLEEALSLWPHPAIHYNMAMAQVQLDRPLEARKHLVAATKFGPEALGETNFESAKTYLKLVERQLSMAVITASMDGVEVSLDGQPLFSSPDTFKDFLPSGTHAIVARKDGYLTSELSETFEPGGQKELNIRLYTAEELTEYRHRWPVWMPWTIFGAGVAVAAVGGTLHGVGVSKIHKFDDHAQANGLLGITTTDADRDLRTDGIALQKGAVGLYAVGGAAIVSGITLIILNKAKPYLFGKPVDDTGSAEGSVATPSAVSLVPVITGDGAGMAATVGF